jgi:hypothetical protein
VIFKLSLPSVGEKTLGKELFAECCICDTRQRALCRVSKIKHSAKSFFAECFLLPSVFYVALGKELLCRVPEIKHSAKNMALGKEPNSGSGLVAMIGRDGTIPQIRLFDSGSMVRT